MPGRKTQKSLDTDLFARLRMGVLIFLLLTINGCDTARQYQQRFLQFGTVIDVTIITDDDNRASRLFEEIDSLLNKRHRDWHGWRDGELKKFNHALQETLGKGIPIPPVLHSLIHDSKKYHRKSGGLFNPAIGMLIAAWGFHAQAEPDFELISRIKTDIPGMDDLKINNGMASTLNPFLQLDFGAIAKGLGVKQIARLLSQHGIQNYIISAGGDVYAMGRKQQRSWRVGIENPFQPGVIASLSLTSSESIFTSGDYHRYHIDENNQRRHHIIDPSTGEPSKHISAASVIHQDPVIADIAATTLMLTPLAELPSMARQLGLEHYLVITKDKQAHISKSLSKRLEWLGDPALKIQLIEAQPEQS